MPRNPPPEFPVRTYPSPNISDQVLIEWITSELTNSKPIEPGSPHPSTRDFAGFKLGIQRVNPLDHNFVQRVWVTDATNQDIYNLALKYSGNSVSAPIFVRTYREPKVSYVARTKGSALQVVYKLAVTNPGSGYTPGVHVPLTFSSGAAAGYGIVGPDGTIAEFVLTAGGAYGSAPTYTVASPPSTSTALLIAGGIQDGKYTERGMANGKRFYNLVGEVDADDGNVVVWNGARWEIISGAPDVIYYSASAVPTPDQATNWKNADDDTAASITVILSDVATGTASIQPTAAVLVEEEALQFPQESEFYAQYFNVVRIYETLPGPVLPYTRFDDDLGPVQGYRQAVLWASQAAEVTATTKTTYEAREGSSIVAWKIVESWSDGTGSAGNPAYPLGITDFYDDERGAVHSVSKIVADVSSVGSLAVAGGTAVTQIRYEPYQDNPALRKKITETWTVPGPTLKNRERYDENLGKITGTRQLVENTSPAQVISSTGSTHYEASKYGAVLIWKIVESWVTADFPTLGPTTSEDEERGTVKTTTQYVVKASQTSTVTMGGGLATYTHYAKTDNPFLLQAIVEVSAAAIVRKGMTREFGGSATLTGTIISTTELYPDLPDFGTLDSKVRTFANGWIKTTVNIDGGDWPTLYDFDIDPETGQTILSSYQVIDANDASTATSVAGIVTRYKHIDQWRSLQIVTTYSDPADYDEQRFGAHNFPALCDGDYVWTPECGAFAPGTRAAFSAMVNMRTTISHTTTKQTIDGLTLIPLSLLLGRGWQLPDCLIDGNTYTYTGECSGSITFSGSDPDYSTYVGSIQGTEQLVTGESVRTQSGLYKNTKVYVVFL